MPGTGENNNRNKTGTLRSFSSIMVSRDEVPVMLGVSWSISVSGKLVCLSIALSGVQVNSYQKNSRYHMNLSIPEITDGGLGDRTKNSRTAVKTNRDANTMRAVT